MILLGRLASLLRNDRCCTEKYQIRTTIITQSWILLEVYSKSNWILQIMLEITMDEFFDPILKKMAWQLRRGNGTFLTMEFGSPKLDIREPIAHAEKNGSSILWRRRVFVRGEWHLWIQYCRWNAQSRSGHEASSEINLAETKSTLEEIDGQFIQSVRYDAEKCNIELNFDLDSKILISPEPGNSDGPVMALFGPQEQYREIRVNTEKGMIVFSGSSDEII